ncbi:MAG: hypothetical protein ABIH00_06780 [Armatimonadota bacterium]
MSNKSEINILKEQIKILEGAVAGTPGNVTACFHLGEIKSVLGFYLEALMCFEKAISKDPRFLKAYIEIAKIYLHKKMYGDTYRVLNKIKDISPKNMEGYLLYKLLKKESKDKNQVIQDYEDFSTSEEEIASLQVNYQLKLGQYDKLIKEYEDLLGQNPSCMRTEFAINVLKRGRDFNKSILGGQTITKTKTKAPLKKAKPKAAKKDVHQNAELSGPLEEFLKLRSVMCAAVFDKKGEIIAQVSLKPAYKNTDYIKLIDNLKYLDKWAKTINKEPNFVSFEYDNGLVFINKLSKKYYFISAGEGLVNFGSLKYTFDKNRQDMLEAIK